jgi:beta-lactamase class A
MEKINAVLKSPKYELYDVDRGGGLWVGKRYAKKGSRRPDPVNGISHGATVTQICRFYYLLSKKRLVSEYRSEQMLNDLSDPELHHKFVYSLEQIVPSAKLYRKSGTWRRWHSDSVLVKDQRWRNYILAAMVESQQGEKILKNLVFLIEQTISPKNNDTN